MTAIIIWVVLQWLRGLLGQSNSVYVSRNYIPPPTPSAVLEMPAPIDTQSVEGETKQKPAVDTTPWGSTEKIADHQYRTYVANDPVMGTPEEILMALNNYRETHKIGRLFHDDRICDLAKKRAIDQAKAGVLDGHKGLIEYMDDPKHWEELNVTGIGENASIGYTLSGVHLIEWVFNADEEHRDNQLNPQWNLACAATDGSTVDIIFGRR